MRASSMEWEFDIELTSEEIKLLENRSLSGKIKVNIREGVLGETPFELRVGEIESNQLYAELRTEPPNVWIDRVVAYEVILSRDGYERLVDVGSTGDRMAWNPSCKIKIYRK